jgi:two-component sensor histidine kinase
MLKSNRLLSESSEKNELLLKELHHRVKNNLQIVSSLFNLQLNDEKMDERSREIFQIAKDRIQSISLLHKMIYQSDHIATLDFGAYLKEFAEQQMKQVHSKVRIQVEVPSLKLSIDIALPLGLIFNELFTNSFKHAGKENELEIKICFENEGDEQHFLYMDNGKGLSETSKANLKKGSIGMELIHLLAEQLDARLDFDNGGQQQEGFWVSMSGNFTAAEPESRYQ